MKTVSNILFLVIINLMVKPFWIFGIDRVVQNELGEATYGIYFTLFNFSLIFQIINDFGLQNYNSKEVAANPGKLDDWLPTILSGKSLLALIYMAVSMAAFTALGYSWTNLGSLFILLMVNQILISLIYYLRSNLAGLHQFRLDTLFSVLDKVLMIVLMLLILYLPASPVALNISNFILAQTLAFALNALLLFIVVRTYTQKLHWHFDRARFVKILQSSLPFALSIFLMSIYLRMDTIMIERLMGEEGRYQAGIYAQSLRIIDALNMGGILFANILIPTYSRTLERKQAIWPILRNAILLLSLIVFPVVAIVLAGHQPIISALYDHDPLVSGRILSILIFSFAAYSFMHLFSSLLTAAGVLRRLNQLFAAGILLNLVANLILIPKMGAEGAAWTTAISQWIMLICIAFTAVAFLRRKSDD